MSQFSDAPPQLDPEWLEEFSHFLDKNNNKKRLTAVRDIFLHEYYEHMRYGLTTKEALEKARVIALCFLV